MSEAAPEGFGPLDADLESLDAELADAGVVARRMLHGQTQPTRYFANALRGRLLATFPAQAAGGGMGSGMGAGVGAQAAAQGTAAPGVEAPARPGTTPSRRPGVRGELSAAGEAWAPVALEPRVARRTPTMLPGRARWALLAAASLTGVIAAGALGARLDWLVPPTASPSVPVTAVDPTSKPPAGPTRAPVVTVPSSDPVPPTVGPDSTPGPTPATATSRPKPTATTKPEPTPKPTARPDPTEEPLGQFDLLAKACPGGVILDWTKPSAGVAKYRTLRKLDGEVPPSYPAAGTTEVDTAASGEAATTDGFDLTITGGDSATYRSFAFDGEDRLRAYSTTRTVMTLGRIPLGDLTVTNAGAGSIDVGWTAADVPDACFTYGKLVASPDDPEPSYLKGSTYLAAIESPSSTGVHLEGLPSGKTLWLRYEIIRATSLGKFVVARTDAVQVTIP